MKKSPPCPQCHYKLGLVKTFTNPCPQCKLNNYRTYEIFKSMEFGQKIPSEKQQKN